MTKKPWSDPFPGLPRRSFFREVESKPAKPAKQPIATRASDTAIDAEAMKAKRLDAARAAAEGASTKPKPRKGKRAKKPSKTTRKAPRT